jgi:hypothetical protein
VTPSPHPQRPGFEPGLPERFVGSPLGRALLIPLSGPHPWGITVQGRKASAPVGPSDLLPTPALLHLNPICLGNLFPPPPLKTRLSVAGFHQHIRYAYFYSPSRFSARSIGILYFTFIPFTILLRTGFRAFHFSPSWELFHFNLIVWAYPARQSLELVWYPMPFKLCF